MADRRGSTVTRWMRWIDRWIGGLLVIVLARTRVLTRRCPIPHIPGYGPNPLPGDIPARGSGRGLGDAPVIVISKYFGMGSILLAVPLLRQIRRVYPSARVFFLSFAANRELLTLAPYVDDRLCIRTTPLAFVIDTVRTLWNVRQARPQVFIDLEFFSRYSALINACSGARVRVGFHTMSLGSRGRLLTHRVSWNSARHAADNFLALGEAIGIPSGSRHLELRAMREADVKAAQSWLHQQGVPARYVVFNPQSHTAEALNSYPAHRWLELAALLHAQTGSNVVFVGSRRDPRWDPQSPGTEAYQWNLSGCTSLQILLVAIQQADCVVTVDSGAAHLAAVFQVPTLVFFGPDTPRLFSPLNPRASVLYAGLHCSPCLNVLEGKQSDCRENVCISRWSPKDVCEQVTALMAPAGSR